ncbi:uncharacterized protein LOC124364940 isoform X3 [Homalodisca vitripennis]|uniref:uncharacterized protein LOC124364940 isoform X3 n=1 Tax=Homalodisca vitripennis TaxID=197043 RepID=UPI001EECC570|nr:uncharacterized protein LOC124364940 isoform X3 [Homalodisca vitripennis]
MFQGVINQVQLGITNDYDSGTDLLAHIDVSSDQVRGLMFQGVINQVQLGITNDYDSGTDLLAHIDVSSDQVRGLMFQGVINQVQLGITNDYDSGTDLLAHIDVSSDQVRGLMFQGVINQVQLGITNDYDSGTDLLAHIDVSSDQVRGLMFQGVINHVQLGITNDYDSGTDLLAHIDVSSDQVRGLMFQGVINHVQLGITNDYDSGTDLLAHIDVSSDQVRGLMFQGVINHVQLGITNDYDSGTDLLAHIDVSSDQVRGLMLQGLINQVQLGITNDYDSGTDLLAHIDKDNNLVQIGISKDMDAGADLLAHLGVSGGDGDGGNQGMGGVAGHIGDGGLANDLGLKLYRAQQSLGNLGQAAQSSLGETKNLLNTLEVANDYVKSALSSGVGHYQEGMDTSGHEFQNQEGIGGMGNLVGADGLSDALKLKLYRADQSLGDLSRAAQTTFGYTEDLLKTVATDIDYSKHLKNVWDTIVEIERLKIETGLDLLNYKLQGIDDLVGFVSTGGLADGLKQKLYRVEQSLGYLSRAAQASVGYTEGLLQVLGTDESYAQPAVGLDIDNMQEGIGKGFDGLVDLQGGDGLSTGLDLNLEGPQQSYIDLAKGVQTSGGIEDPLGIVKTDNNYAKYSIKL